MLCKQIMIEKILCSAVWFPLIPLKKEIKDNCNPININQGLVFIGFRHCHCIYTMCSITGLAQHEAGGNEIQGFLTNKNRFVTREEAANIALRENQIKNLDRFNGVKLYSEDLY